MQSTSPYTPPQGELIDESAEYGRIKVFSASGRIGRLRYIGYSIGVTLVIYLAMAVLMALLGAMMPEQTLMAALPLVMSVAVIAILIVSVLLTIQRSHDFNVTGWLSLLLLVPLAPLIFWIVPGTKGSNNYGLQPPPNRGLAVVIVLLLFVAVIGILAAIAIPAYQNYMAQVQAMGG